MPVSAPIVHQRLHEASRKLRWSRSSRYFIGGAALALVFLALFLVVDAWLHFGAAGRWTGFGLIVASLAAGGLLGARAWRKQLSEAAAARRIEEACDGAGNVLISAVQFDRTLPPNSTLRTALFNEMSDPFPRVQWDRVFDLRLLKRLALILSGALALVFGWAVLQPKYFTNSAARLLLPASNIAPLTRTKIQSLIPGNDMVVRGREVVLQATLAGDVPKSAWVWYREAGSSWQKAIMNREAGQPIFEFTWKEMRQPLEYYVEAGDARSVTHRLDVRPKTAIRARTAEITPPAYTGLARQAVKDFSVLQNVLPGSEAAIMIDFNNDVTEFSAADEKGQAFETQQLAPAQWKFTSRVASNQAVKLTYRDALQVPDNATVQIAVKPDEPPKITITEPAEGRELVAVKGARLPIKFTATDAYGLASVALYQSTSDKEDAKLLQEWKEADGQKNFDTTTQAPLAPLGDEDRVTLRIVVRDRNDVTGPGVTSSRPIVVALQSPEKLTQQMDDAASKLQQGLDALIKLQAQNLDETKIAQRKQAGAQIAPLVDRQAQVADQARKIAASAELISADVRREIQAMLQKEMKDAVIALRGAGTVTGEPRGKLLNAAAVVESVILARLQGAPAAAEDDAKKNEISDLISGLEDLLKKQRELHKETNGAPPDKTPALSERQDQLADKAVNVRKGIENDSKNASIGDESFRQRLGKVATMFGTFRIYEDMLGAAEALSTKNAAPALATQQRVVVNLAKMVELLNQWQLAEAEKKAEDLRREAEEMQQKLDKLAEIQRDIVEKTKEMARKNDFRPEDISTSAEIQEQKDLMKEVVEQMVTDMHAFPDMKPGNEMKGELVSILEDVDQADKQEVAEGKLKPNEIAVQKEQGLLDAIEQAKKIAADMEMWIPNKNEKEKWLMENFDKNEMPEIPNLPLADAFEDIVGNLLDEQEDMKQDIQDAASNQAMAMNPANGWEIRDGPMPGFGAQGKSGNERPNHNEQMGRSSGGREGMSDGEMAGDRASNLEGDTPEARRTKDPLQQGQVQDDGGIGKTRATGGGKAGGFSDRQGMEGDAPIRAVKAPQQAADAAAVKQALLQEKTAKTVAQASLLYIRSDNLAEVAQMMGDSEQAMREGRMRDAASLHQKIVGRLKELKNGVASGEVVSFAAGDGARSGDKQLLGGSEGETPAAYKEQVADYFRALVEEK